VNGDLRHIFLVAGEPSGDLHAAGLVTALRRLRPGIRVTGIGGRHLQDAGVDLLYHTDTLAFMGFTEVLRHLPYLWRVMREVRRFLDRERPDLVVLVDYPGFNLRLAPHARAAGCRVLYYISPQLWAWHEQRVVALARSTDLLACVLPFEPDFYERMRTVYGEAPDVRFVGHPLLDVAVAGDPEGLRRELLIPPGAELLALLPGSRRQEIEQLLPAMAGAVALLRDRRPDLFPVLCAAPGVPRGIYASILGRAGIVLAPAIPAGSVRSPREGIVAVGGRTYDVMGAARGALVASGTATLETGLFGTPMVIAYRLNPISWRIGRSRVRVPHIGLVNLVAGERVVPELLQEKVTPESLAESLGPLLDDGVERERVKTALAGVRQRLGEPGAAERTARLALGLLGERP
jgi:lipid-A-disaccharide synthase